MKTDSATSLILFITPSTKSVNGGVMSIFSLTRESRKLRKVHGAAVALCVYPGDKSYKKNDLFDNDEYVNDFDEIMKKYPKLDKLLIHIPELVVDRMNVAFTKYAQYLEEIPYVHFNIMNQNIQFMQRPEDIAPLYRFADHITQTTAHKKYATQSISDKFSLALKHLSVFIDPAQYTRVPLAKKHDLIAYSRDKHAMKSQIIEHLVSSLPNYKFVEIDDMTYDEYKTTVANAKYTITFGEGLDGYLIESTFSGGIGVAAYNDDFFPDEDFKKEPFIYPDYTAMYERLANDIQRTEKHSYAAAVASMYKKLADIYSYDQYIQNLTKFYKGNLDFTPSYASTENLPRLVASHLTSQMNDVKQTLSSSQNLVTELNERTAALNNKNKVYENKLKELENSTSWRLTQPLRIIMSQLRKILQ